MANPRNLAKIAPIVTSTEGNLILTSGLEAKGGIKITGAVSGFVGLNVASNAGNVTYTLPASDGLNGNVLSTNGAGSLIWIPQSAGGGSTPGSGTSTARTTVVATEGQTTFSVSYVVGQIDVYFNGIKLVIGTEVTCTSGTNIVLAKAAKAGDVIDVVVYTTQWITSVTNLYYSGGNVGIGTDIPNYSSFGGTNRVLSIKGSSTYGGLELVSDANAANGNILGQFVFANAGAGVTSKDAALIEGKQSGASATAPGGSLHFYTRANAGSLSERMTISNAGMAKIGSYISIGSTHNNNGSILSNLVWDGTSYTKVFSGAAGAGGWTITSVGGGGSEIVFSNKVWGTDSSSINAGDWLSNEKMRITSDGNLLIGTQNTQNSRLVSNGGNSNFAGDFWVDGEAYNLTSSNRGSIYEVSGTVMRVIATTNSVNSGALINFNAYNTSGGATGAFLGAVAGTTGNGPAHLVFGRRTGTTAWAESARITSDGQLLIGATSASQGTTGSIRMPSSAFIHDNGFSRFWLRPGQQIGSASYAGLYGPALTYLVKYDGGWKSTGGGTASALTIDEGIFSFSNSNSASDANQSITWTTRMVINTSGDVLVGTTSGIGPGAKMNIFSGGNALHVQSSSGAANNIVSYNSAGTQTAALSNAGNLSISGALSSASRFANGSFKAVNFGTNWSNIFTISAASDTVVWFALKCMNTENGGMSHVTIYGYAVIRHNGSPFEDFYGMNAVWDAVMQPAAGSAFTQFQFVTVAGVSSDLVLQVRNTNYGNNLYIYEANILSGSVTWNV